MKTIPTLRRLANAAASLSLATLAVGGSTSIGATGTEIAWTVAGRGISGNTGDGDQASEAAIDQPRSVFPTADGGYVWAQPWSNRVRKVGPDGVVTTLAGAGSAGFSGDGGQATSAQLNFVHSAAPTPDGGYVLADELNNRIRRVSPSGVISTVAGTGVAGFSGDGGPATAAQINNPRGVVALPDGGFLIPDSNNHRVRRVSPSGIISTVAGTGVQGFTGDGGVATAAQLSIPFGVAPTADGGFLIVDVGNQRIRKVSVSGVITTVAGTGVAGYNGDGIPATAARLFNPHNVVEQSDGSILIADTSNARIRRVASDGIITTMAGTGVQGFGGDGGPAAAALFSAPKAVGVTGAGAAIVADEQNNRIRFLGSIVAPANTALPTISGTPQEGRALTATAGGWSGTGPAFTYQWRRCDTAGEACSDIAGAAAKTYVVGTNDIGFRLRVRATGSNPSGSASATSVASSTVTDVGAPPENQTSPTISGDPQVGQLLTASPGAWSGSQPIDYRYQWRRCDGSGANCADIPGATAATYTVTSSDSGFTLRVRIAASNGSSSSVYSNAVLADDPLSYWRFGEPSGPLVDVQGFKDASAANDPQRNVAGLISGDAGTAVALNGSSQYLEVPADTSWTSQTFSIELVVKPSALPVNKTIWSTQELFRGWWLNTDLNGAVRMFVGNGSSWQFNPSGPVLTPGVAHHLVATYDGARARLYVNGSLVSTGPTATMAPNSTTAPMRLGQVEGPGQYWAGVLDDASFYLSTLTAAQVSAHFDASVNGSTATSAETALVSGVAPSNSVVPVVSGVAEVGRTLSSSAGSWSGTAPISYAYQWRRCDSAGAGCVDIGGATAATYVVVGADVGSRLRAVVTASNGVGSASASSAATAVVVAQPTSGTLTFAVGAGGDDGDVWVQGPQSGGYPPSGSVSFLTTNSFFTVARRAVFGNFQVFAGLLRFDTSALPDGATIESASLKLSVLAKADADNRGLEGEWYSAANWPIDAGDSSVASSGSAFPSLDITDLSTTAVTSVALSGLSSISTTGSTGLRLHLGGGQPSGDNYLQVAAFEHSSRPEAELVVSYTTAPAAPSNSVVPVVSGVAEVGRTLSSSAGSWSGTAPISYAYQWRRCDSAGAGCVDIGGATAATYVVVGADVGSRLRAVVTASNGVGSASASSAATALVVAQPTSGTLTFAVGAGGDDGDVWVQGPQSGGYPPSGSVSFLTTNSFFTVARRAVFGNFQVFAGLLRFDTSALPDGATIESASLKLSVLAKADADNRGLEGEWYSAANWPIDAGDSSVASSGSAFPSLDITDLSTTAVTSVALSGLSSISTTGSTGLRLHLGGGQPSGDNYLQVAAFEHSSRPEAELVVSYTTAPAAPSNSVVPVVSGVAEVGRTLSSSAGSWSGTAPISYAYQWRRCDSAGAGCVDIGGATAATYVVVGADVGSRLRAVVTASNGVGSASASSAATAVVVAQPTSGTLTFAVGAGGDDGDVWVQGPQSGGYPPSGSVSFLTTNSFFTVARRAVFGNFQVFAGLLRFDTSALPDGATIESASLKLSVLAKADADNRGLEGEWYSAANWPIDAGDSSVASSGSAFPSLDITDLSTTAVTSVALSGLSSISTTGSTGLRLHLGGGQPSGDNYLQVAAFEHSSRPEAELVVNYVLP